MIPQAKNAIKAVRRFLKDEAGMASLESILLIPLLFWAYVATFVMFDAYKKQTDGLRVTYSVADAISREENEINQSYLNSMVQLSNFLTRSPSSVTQRVSIVCYSATDTAYRIAWSRTTGPRSNFYTPHTNASIVNYNERLPIIPVGDQIILVETFMQYAPIWDIGLSEQTFDYWVFTRPRFTNQLKWTGQPSWTCPPT